MAAGVGKGNLGMAEIRVLPEVVQNKIAAGEVIERPASAVKELIENALDASANKITVEIAGGGAELIRVSDNGWGMDAENLDRCIERHATSKIREASDIFQISSFGFRGEALPSIGAVAKLTISSGVNSTAPAQQITVTGGTKTPLQPAPPRQGTIVEVRDLFFNTPARRKFMKSVAAEMAQISEVITRLALAYPKVSFYFDNHQRRALELTASPDLYARIVMLFGDNFPLLPVNYDDHGLQISGFIAAPPESRANSKQIYTLLNRRWFRHNGLLRATADACAGNLPPRRFPFTVLNFTIDTDRIDVNVHPTKEVIRFENEQILIGGAHHAIRLALKLGGMPTLPDEYQKTQVVSGASSTKPPTPLPRYSSNFSPRSFNEIHVDRNRHHATSGNKYAFTTTGNSPASEDTDSEKDETPPHLSAAPDLLSGGNWRYLGQAGEKYLVVETATGIMLVDQHALHERYLFEQLRTQSRPIIRQQLLMPVEIKLSNSERGAIESALAALQDAGFTATLIDEIILRITACPDFVRIDKAVEVCRDVLTVDPQLPLTQLRESMLAKIACHSAVLFGTALVPDLALDLLEKLLNHWLPTCPHGRPTTITLSWAELANRFRR